MFKNPIDHVFADVGRSREIFDKITLTGVIIVKKQLKQVFRLE